MRQASPTITPHEAGSSHLIQLFDSEESNAEGVAQFLRDGIVRSEQILVLVSAERWYSIAMRMSARGRPVDEALRCGRAIVRDARQTLGRFMVDDRIRPGLFHATVGTLVEGMAAFRKPVRIYSDMVDLLTARGDYASALELEDLWNQLARQHRFTLLCGYSAGHFGDPRNADDLCRTCAAHSGVRSNPEDVLGSFLVGRYHAA
jgi:hypothetical protein